MSETEADVKAHGWTTGKVLGQGAFGKVYLVTRATDKQQAAVKVVKKPATASKMKLVETEAKILKSIHHPAIVECFDVFETDTNMYFIMELMGGGELFDRIVDMGHFTEKMAQDVSFKLLGALQYMHEKGVCHRDLKPENLLLTSKKQDAEIKITDFGLAKVIDDETTIMKTACGTPGYVAPEVISQAGNYGYGVDVWSYGVILYILLCGFPPFYGDNDAQMFKMIKAGAYKFLKPYWDPISGDAKDFIAKMLVVDASKRATIPELLKHAWLKDQVAAVEVAKAVGNTTRRSVFATDATTDNTVNLAKFDEYPIQETKKKLNRTRWQKAGLAVRLSNRLSKLTATSESDESTTVTVGVGVASSAPQDVAVVVEKDKSGGCCVIA